MENPFVRRRAELMRRIGERAVAIVHGGRAARRNRDVEYKFRPRSDLLFLTGFQEPDAVAVLGPGRPQPFTLFVRPRDPELEMWGGRRLGVEGATGRLGADQAFPIAELPAKLPELLDGAEEVHFSPGDDGELDQLVIRTIAWLRSAERKGKRAPTRVIDLVATLHELRLLKDDDALEKLRRAVDITVEAHTLAMRAARPGVHEYEIEALVDYTFRRRGGTGPGYATIVGGGANATILHYTDNADVLREGELVLVDAGCEHQGFTADITRTFPVSGRFSDAQRRCYELVLETQKSCVAMVRPGATIDEIHRRATELLAEGMVRLGLLEGEVPHLIEKEAQKRFYPHRTSHWLGLDVHDVGLYNPEGRARPLAPGMVLTVEPGLYVAVDAADVPRELRGLGIRVEDDVLVTDAGHEVLTRAVPKEVDEIEALTAGDALG